MARRSGAVCDHCWFDERQRRAVFKMCNVPRGVFISVEVFWDAFFYADLRYSVMHCSK